MQGSIVLSTLGYAWRFNYDSGVSKLHAMDDADKVIRTNPDAEIIEWNESMEVSQS